VFIDQAVSQLDSEQRTDLSISSTRSGVRLRQRRDRNHPGRKLRGFDEGVPDPADHSPPVPRLRQAPTSRRLSSMPDRYGTACASTRT
jgi:hypothetical protein